MAAPEKYPGEARELATRMSVEARCDPATKAGVSAHVAQQLGLNPEPLRNWVRQAEKARSIGYGHTGTVL